ncbi:hypothetical protein V6N13_060390 [Hibiscus sabdariffa]
MAIDALRRGKIQQLIANVRRCCLKGEAINIGQAAFDTTINLLSNTIFSMDLVDQSSSIAREFRETICGVMVEAGKPNLADYFPFLRKIDPQGVRHRMTVHFDKLLNLFGEMFDERLLSRKSKGSLLNAFDWKLEGGISPSEINMEEKFGLSVQMAEPLQTIPVLVLE